MSLVFARGPSIGEHQGSRLSQNDTAILLTDVLDVVQVSCEQSNDCIKIMCPLIIIIQPIALRTAQHIEQCTTPKRMMRITAV